MFGTSILRFFVYHIKKKQCTNVQLSCYCWNIKQHSHSQLRNARRLIWTRPLSSTWGDGRVWTGFMIKSEETLQTLRVNEQLFSCSGGITSTVQWCSQIFPRRQNSKPVPSIIHPLGILLWVSPTVIKKRGKQLGTNKAKRFQNAISFKMFKCQSSANPQPVLISTEAATVMLLFEPLVSLLRFVSSSVMFSSPAEVSICNRPGRRWWPGPWPSNKRLY